MTNKLESLTEPLILAPCESSSDPVGDLAVIGVLLRQGGDKALQALNLAINSHQSEPPGQDANKINVASILREALQGGGTSESKQAKWRSLMLLKIVAIPYLHSDQSLSLIANPILQVALVRS